MKPKSNQPAPPNPSQPPRPKDSPRIVGKHIVDRVAELRGKSVTIVGGVPPKK